MNSNNDLDISDLFSTSVENGYNNAPTLNARLATKQEELRRTFWEYNYHWYREIQKRKKITLKK